MKLIYTNENRFLVSNVKNIVEAQGIEVMLKNEYAVGGMGEIPTFETWLELWIVHDADYDRAMAIVEGSLGKKGGPDWTCPTCNEMNDASFETCWQCQTQKP